MTAKMKRRDFIALLGGAALGWPLAARAQQPRERMRRIGVLNPLAADDPQSQRRMTAFVCGLQQFGWTDGHNVTIETRWGAGDSERLRRYAAELVALAPDVILAVAVSSMVHCNMQPARCRSCSCRSPTPSVLDSSRVCRGRVAMRPAFPCRNTASAQNGWNYSSKSPHT